MSEVLIRLLNETVSFGLATTESISKRAYLLEYDEDELVGCLGYMFSIDGNPVIDQVAVKESHRKRGIASKLLSQFCQQYIDFDITIIGWKSPGGWSLENIAKKHDFKIVDEIEFYWHSDDSHCPHCGTPCECSAVIAVCYSCV